MSLAAQMRGWMAGRSYKFTLDHICEALGANKAERVQVSKAMQDFVHRGEVVPLGNDKRCKVPVAWFAYNPSWHRMNKGVLNQRIYKAMRLISFREAFTVADIQRTTQSDDRNWIDKIVRKLIKSGYLRLEGVGANNDSPLRPAGGREKLYRVIDTDRFLLEVMR